MPLVTRHYAHGSHADFPMPSWFSQPASPPRPRPSSGRPSCPPRSRPSTHAVRGSPNQPILLISSAQQASQCYRGELCRIVYALSSLAVRPLLEQADKSIHPCIPLYALSSFRSSSHEHVCSREEVPFRARRENEDKGYKSIQGESPCMLL